MVKILLVFGTRPEAIKMCPVILELKKRNGVQVVVCVTGQHREQLDQVLDVFGVVPDYDLNIMKERQTLFDITVNVMNGMDRVLFKEKPDAVLVHGDTTTAFSAMVSAFFHHIPIGHVEAGLRTYDMEAPFPEEFNRQCIAVPARWNFAPTEWCRQNLLKEGKKPESIYVTGNTVIDAMRTTVRFDFDDPILHWAGGCRMVFMTAHRRENIGEPMRQIFRAVKRVVYEHTDVKVVYPVHRNPEVWRIAVEELGGLDKFLLAEPLDVIACHNIMAQSYMILTDSGGIQEEATALGKPTLVLRDTTERPEGIEAGTLKLVGTSKEKVMEAFCRVLDDPCEFYRMAQARNPYGDGHASEKIADILLGGGSDGNR